MAVLTFIFFSILERNDECVLEFVRNATFAAQHLVVIG